MTAPDLHTLTGAYAMDALDAEERDAFEAHLRECAACREEVAELAATATRLAHAAATTPPAGLRERVLAEVATTRQVPPVAGVTDLSTRRRAWYLQPASAAAALLLVVSAALGVATWQAQQEASHAEQRAARVSAIATDPDRMEQVVTLPAGGRGMVLAADGAAMLRVRGAALLPPGEVYQLWVLRAGGPVSAGVLGRGGELEALVENVGSGEGLGMTVEPAGGSAAPTGDLVLRVSMS